MTDFGYRKVRGKGGVEVGQQLDLATPAGKEAPPPARRERGVPPPRCTTSTVDGWCEGQLVAKPREMWVCPRCGKLQSTAEVAGRRRWVGPR